MDLNKSQTFVQGIANTPIMQLLPFLTMKLTFFPGACLYNVQMFSFTFYIVSTFDFFNLFPLGVLDS